MNTAVKVLDLYLIIIDAIIIRCKAAPPNLRHVTNVDGVPYYRSIVDLKIKNFLRQGAAIFIFMLHLFSVVTISYVLLFTGDVDADGEIDVDVINKNFIDPKHRMGLYGYLYSIVPILFRCLILSFSVTLIAIPIILLVVNGLVLIGIQISFLAGGKTLKSYTNSNGCINYIRKALTKKHNNATQHFSSKHRGGQ